ncbi:MAG TPA: TlpA disulfide reductase family protein [Acidimicrobiia bacterium]|nr:TlpA disulfide reductase family protein [Acidimicrobiia bacterium]
MSRAHLQHKPIPAPVRRQSRAVWWGLGIVVFAALALAVTLSGGGEEVMPVNPQVAITGSSLPSFEGDPLNDPALGLAAPSLAGADFAGQQVQIEAGDGRPKVIVFLAHWCPHCQAEVPVLQEYEDSVGFPASFDLYSVATAYSSTRPNWPPSSWLEREGWTFPLIVDDAGSSAFTVYGQGNFPYYVFLRGDGTVALRFSGELGAAALIATMEDLTGS